MIRHIDFTNYVLFVEDLPETPIRIVEARAEFCEMCDPGTWDNPNEQEAEFVVDAVSVLGDGGHNVAYCYKHMYAAVFVCPESPDVWMLETLVSHLSVAKEV